VIYRDDFLCVVSKSSGHRGRLTLRQYLKAMHVGVGVLAGQPTIPDQRLAVLGEKRRFALEVPFFTAAIRCVRGTDLIATVPRRLAQLEAHDAAIRFVEPPPEIYGFEYTMIWHPRLHSDAAHVWMRQLIADAARGLDTPQGTSQRVRRVSGARASGNVSRR
jgi:DNA-binding transcriptional LysR family regulator